MGELFIVVVLATALFYLKSVIGFFECLGGRHKYIYFPHMWVNPAIKGSPCICGRCEKAFNGYKEFDPETDPLYKKND